MAELRIDIKDFISTKDTALVGRDYGKELLAKVISKVGDFSVIETQYDLITFSLPKRIITINKSFFLGFFEGIITRIGKEMFLSKYKFEASEYITGKIPSYVDSALLSATMKDILNV